VKTRVRRERQNRNHRRAEQKRKRRQELQKRGRRIKRRLAVAGDSEDSGRPVMTMQRVSYEIGERTRAIAHGGIGAVHQLAVRSGLVERIDAGLHLLKLHRPYHESDHVLNIAYNALCGGERLEDIELRRNDEAFLDGLGAAAIPDPTTAGDFCRRFEQFHIDVLMDIINETRLEVWKRQGPAFTSSTARIDSDGTMVTTTGECKEGMAMSHKGEWGYQPLLVSLANTAEPLFIANRSGNRPSYEGAVRYMDKAIVLCRRAGFVDILLRGDTDFSRTTEFDRWDDEGVRFVFGYDAFKNLKAWANGMPPEVYRHLARRADKVFAEREQRARQPRVKEQIVREKGYRNIKLRSAEIAEFDYKPTACKRAYRMVVVRKNLSIEKGDQPLYDEVRYFFYVTNDRKLTAEEVVREANQRCNQENLIAQLKNGVRALHAPVNTLNANWAYMVMTSLAWSLKAWMALWLPISPRWADKHQAERDAWLRMEFRTFRNAVIEMPTQILRTGRGLVYRLLCWRPQQSVFLRLIDAL